MNTLTDSQFAKFRDVIYDASGISFSSVNRPILESRVKERLRIKKLETPDEYFSLIQEQEGELRLFLDSVTTNLTKFFRNEAHYEALKENVFPEIIERKKLNSNHVIKIWSAGCSTGEEAYSIAMVLIDLLPNYQSWKVDILASDLSLKSLLIAKEGYYSREKVDAIDNHYVTKFFEPHKEGYKVKDFVKEIIRFDYHNLKYDNGERDLDIIFCRNVIIYFDRTAQEKTITRFFEALNDDGYLYIGHSESLFGMNSGFKFNKIGNAIIYRKM